MPGLLVLWGGACLTGFCLLAVHAYTPGPEGAPASRDEPAVGTRVDVFIHPKCPCTRATLTELEEVMRLAGQKVTRLRFVVETPETGSWEMEGTLQHLRRFGKSSEIQFDPGGRTARERGVETSGHLLAYNAAGNLIFQGGITGGRGHAGDNPGRAALLNALRSISVTPATPVYGCRL